MSEVKNYFCSFISSEMIVGFLLKGKSERSGVSSPVLFAHQDSLLSEGFPHFNLEDVKSLGDHLGLKFTPEKEEELEENASPVCYAQSPELREGFEIEIPPSTFSPIDILGYVYAILHSPVYREKYKEFLEIDFPRVPYPKDQKTFWELVKLGDKIRKIHLLESAEVSPSIATYPIDGDNTIARPVGKKDWELYDQEQRLGRVWINDKQYFDRVPLVAWEFYIGGYQPAQKWLKDKKGRELNFDDILHYQKIIVALIETDKLMRAIGEIQVE